MVVALATVYTAEVVRSAPIFNIFWKLHKWDLLVLSQKGLFLNKVFKDEWILTRQKRGCGYSRPRGQQVQGHERMTGTAKPRCSEKLCMTGLWGWTLCQAMGWRLDQGGCLGPYSQWPCRVCRGVWTWPQRQERPNKIYKARSDKSAIFIGTQFWWCWRGHKEHQLGDS